MKHSVKMSEKTIPELKLASENSLSVYARSQLRSYYFKQ